MAIGISPYRSINMKSTPMVSTVTYTFRILPLEAFRYNIRAGVRAGSEAGSSELFARHRYFDGKYDVRTLLVGVLTITDIPHSRESARTVCTP